MNTPDTDPLPNPELEARIRLAALERHNNALNARCWRAVLLIVAATAALCAGVAILL